MRIEEAACGRVTFGKVGRIRNVTMAFVAYVLVLMIRDLMAPSPSAKVVAFGDRDLKYLTHRAVDLTIGLLPPTIDCQWVASDSDAAGALDEVDGVWLLPGTPYKDDEASFDAIRHCLATQTPFLGTCGGFQYACVELARSVVGVADAAHAETAPEGAADLVVVPLACQLYGERRLVNPREGTHFAAVCGSEPFDGFHWCGYGLSDAWAARLRAVGVVISATAPGVGVEAIELPGHPFFMATAFQPQVESIETLRLHPLIDAFIAAAETRAFSRQAQMPLATERLVP